MAVWDSERNRANGMDPSEWGARSNKRFHWVCECGTRWEGTAAGRSSAKNPDKCRSCVISRTQKGVALRARRKPRQTYGDLTGQRFGSRLVLRKANVSGSWLVRCDCGKEARISAPALVKGVRCIVCYQRSKQGPISGEFWQRIQIGARARSKKFEITQGEAVSVFESQGGRCALTGTPLRLPATNREYNEWAASSPNMASLDRIDSALGYHVGNVQWVTKVANQSKQSMTNLEFVAFCQMVVRNHAAAG